jgi:hypothetical protein
MIINIGVQMTVNNVSTQQTVEPEKSPMTVQLELQKDVMKDTMGANGPQKQLSASLANTQPSQQVQRTALEQLSRGYLDIKV